MRRRLNPILIPDDCDLRRDVVIPHHCRSDDFEEKYDYKTIAYDAIYFPESKMVCLVCPKLYSFEKILRNGRFLSSDEMLKIISINKRPRYDEVWLRSRAPIHRISFHSDRFSLEFQLSPEEGNRFFGLNCCVTLSKNNNLEWIRDWTAYHVRTHSADSVIFFDNGSDRYDPDAIGEVFQSIPGLKTYLVMSSNYKFGPRGKYEFAHHSRFLQVSMLNIARLRFLQTANAVLNIDIDEIVAPMADSNIFEHTKNSFLGYKLFHGRWRDALRPGESIVRHSDHFYKKGNDLCKNTKYCIAPSGLFGFSHWEVHGAVKGFLKDAMTSKEIHYIHCRGITTNWKGSRNASSEHELTLDPITKKIIDDAFGRTDSVGAAASYATQDSEES